jgi:hypothetical protein
MPLCDVKFRHVLHKTFCLIGSRVRVNVYQINIILAYKIHVLFNIHAITHTIYAHPIHTPTVPINQAKQWTNIKFSEHLIAAPMVTVHVSGISQEN